MHYGFAIDTQRCIGCHTCAVACRMENNLPVDTWWNRILTVDSEHMDIPVGDYPNLSLDYITLACQHCENPACVKVCPVGATYKDEKTGAVRQDNDKCIGCRMCMAACPYTGVRSFNWGEPSYHVDVDLGGSGVPKHQKHTVEKCTMCWHRLAHDEKPSCIDQCPERARYFGDLDDPESEISQVIASRSVKQLLSSEGTKPSAYYLV